jgi:ABC-type polysaccharide/polyol phosphate export permease
MRLAESAHLLREWMRRDLRSRYQQTLLGGFWALVQPITLTASFVFIFGHIAKLDVGVPYASFVYPAMLLWTLFSAGVLGGTSSMLASIPIAARAQYPRVVAPMSGALLPVFDFTIGLVLMPVLFVVQDPPLHLRPVSFFLALAGVLVLAVGIGTLLSALAVFIRDVQRVVPILLQLLLFVTPVAYPSDRIPSWLALNPMATYVEAMRSSFLESPGPDLTKWIVALATSLGFLGLGMLYFHRVERRFPDVA